MRILAIQPFLRGQLLSPTAGGKNKAAFTLARRLAEEGNEVFLLPWKRERYADSVTFRLGSGDLRATALPTLRLPGLSTPARIGRRFLFDRDLPKAPGARLRAASKEELLGRRGTLAAALRRTRPDVVHVHESHSDAGSVYAGLGCSAPILLTHHSPGLAESCPYYNRVVFVSERQRQAALRRWPELEERMSVIHYFAGDGFHRVPYGLRKTGFVFVGGLDNDRKGLDLLLEGWSESPELRRHRLEVVGEGTRRSKYEQVARDRGLPFVFRGRLDESQIAACLAQAAAFVMPSRAEGLALVYLEALCMGLPILGFGPNVEELDRALGTTVGYGFDPAAEPVSRLIELALSLVDSRGQFTATRRAELGRRARRLFSRTRFEHEYLRLYDSLGVGKRGTAE